MTVTALVFVTYCAGNIAGPQTFKSSEAKQCVFSPFLSASPRTNDLCRGYPTAFKAILICYGLVIIVALSLRLYLTQVNKRRDREEGAAAEIAAAGAIPVEKRLLAAEEYEDITDLNTPGFRYRM
jgi:hypothetical protein